MFCSLFSAAAALVSDSDFSVFILCDSFSILLLCLPLHFFLFLEGESGPDTPSQEVSEKVSVQNDTAREVTRGGSRCWVLQELW